MDQIKKIKVVSDPDFNEDSGNTHLDFVRPTVFALELCNDGLGKDGASELNPRMMTISSPGSLHGELSPLGSEDCTFICQSIRHWSLTVFRPKIVPSRLLLD